MSLKSEKEKVHRDVDSGISVSWQVHLLLAVDSPVLQQQRGDEEFVVVVVVVVLRLLCCLMPR
jgi:hypothetical protein